MAVIFVTRNRFQTQPVRSVQIEYKRGVYINFLVMYVFFKHTDNAFGTLTHLPATYVMTDMEGGMSGPRPTEFS
jgi:hypothetical protein